MCLTVDESVMFVTHVKHFNLKIHLDDMDNIICESVCEGLRHTEHPGQKLHTSVRNNKSVTLQSERKGKKKKLSPNSPRPTKTPCFNSQRCQLTLHTNSSRLPNRIPELMLEYPTHLSSQREPIPSPLACRALGSIS